MASIGWGGYSAARIESLRASGTSLALFHKCWNVAATAYTTALFPLYIWRGDRCEPADEWDESLPPEQEARRLADRCWSQLRALTPNPFIAVTGPCECYPSKSDPRYHERLQYRAALELALCRIAQSEYHVCYAALGCAVGNIDADEVLLFADVFREASLINYHGYLGPGRRSLAEETDDWYLWRPVRIWAPELRAVGITGWRMLLGECGTYESWTQLGMSRDDGARLCVEIHSAMEAACAGAGISYVGSIPFAYGTEGVMRDDGWELEGSESIIAAAQRVDAAGPPVAAPPTVPPHPDAVEVETMSDPFLAWAADVFARAGVPFNPDAAIVKYWLDSARRGDYLGRPEGPEHPVGGWVVQEFASEILYWDPHSSRVLTGIPFA